jgi:hypothetical protein
MKNPIEPIVPSELLKLANGRDFLPTKEAAHSLSRTAQTLRIWACYSKGPILPVRQGGRLGWRVTDLARYLNGGAAS